MSGSSAVSANIEAAFGIIHLQNENEATGSKLALSSKKNLRGCPVKWRLWLVQYNSEVAHRPRKLEATDSILRLPWNKLAQETIAVDVGKDITTYRIVS